MITAVVPSRTNAYINRLLDSIKNTNPALLTANPLLEIVIGDNGLSSKTSSEIKAAYSAVKVIQTPNPFIFAQTINCCVAAGNPESDILILNDDTEIVDPNFFQTLQAEIVSKSTARFGVLSPKILGGSGNTDQMDALDSSTPVKTRKPVCFIAALVRRAVWNQVGPLDERFDGYGWEDTDFCYDKETQIMVRGEIKYIKDVTYEDDILTLNDDGFMEYHKPTNLIQKYESKLLHFKTKRLDLMVTPDQDLLVGFKRKERGQFRDLSFVKASEIAKKLRVREDRYFVKKGGGGWQGRHLDNIQIGPICWPGDLYLELAAWYLSEGSIEDKNWLKISQSSEVNPKKHQKIWDLAGKLKLIWDTQCPDTEFKISKHKDSVRIKCETLVAYFRMFGDTASSKFIPAVISSLDQDQLGIFLTTYTSGDGTLKPNGFGIVTSSDKMKDGLIDIILKTGNTFSVGLYGGGLTDFDNGGIYDCNPCWNIQSYRDTDKALLQRPIEVEYNDLTYDITVPNHRIYVIRNGKGCWSSNCRRAVEAGWDLGILTSICIRHGFPDRSMSGTFGRLYTGDKHTTMYYGNAKKFEQKWGEGPQLGLYEIAPDRVVDTLEVDAKLSVFGVGDVGGGGSRSIFVPFDDAVETVAELFDKEQKDTAPVLGEEGPNIVYVSDASGLPDTQEFLNTLETRFPWELSKLTREELTKNYPAPLEATLHAQDTDIQADISLLWSLVVATKAKMVVELGVRHGISTKTIAHAMKHVSASTGQTGRLIALDPDAECITHLQSLLIIGASNPVFTFLAMYGEHFVANISAYIPSLEKVDFLMIDTDPHEYDQTMMWLNVWENLLAPGACVVFHDIVQNRPEIQVAQAVREWVKTRPDWTWVEYPVNPGKYRWPQGGLGALWAPKGK